MAGGFMTPTLALAHLGDTVARVRHELLGLRTEGPPPVAPTLSGGPGHGLIEVHDRRSALTVSGSTTHSSDPGGSDASVPKAVAEAEAAEGAGLEPLVSRQMWAGTVVGS